MTELLRQLVRQLRRLHKQVVKVLPVRNTTVAASAAMRSLVVMRIRIRTEG